ncbi:MAG: SHOCT domain-containing protein [Chloroflexi bacterium]|nr:SHOCT domain-containing protein [Chloroflexota bacterium]
MKSSTIWIGGLIGVALVCAVVFVAGFPLMARGHGAMMGAYGEYGMMGGGAVIGLWRLALMGLFGLIVVAVIGTAISLRTGHNPAEPPAAVLSPLDVLKLRYARGEIDKAQFEQMKIDIR